MTSITLTIDINDKKVDDDPSLVSKILDSISCEIIETEDYSGFIHDPFTLSYDLEIPGIFPEIDLDERQKKAAAIILMAIDLPAEMPAYSRSMLKASRICRNMTTNDIPQSRAEALKRARDLIDEMLSE